MPAQPAIERVVVHVLNSHAFSGYRVAFLTDFHVTPWQRGVLTSAIDIINSWEPDLVALGGDYGYTFPPFRSLSRASYRAVIPRLALELSRLSARDGIVAVLGNHDFAAGAEIVAAEFSAIGVQLLRNEMREITRRDRRLRIVGVIDAAGAVPHFGRLERQPGSNVDATLLISHHPIAASGFQSFAAPDPLVIIAGHTHGGQITFPFIGAPITLSRVATRRFPAGFVPNETAALYVSRGLGEQVPLRVGAAREITLLELVER